MTEIEETIYTELKKVEEQYIELFKKYPVQSEKFLSEYNDLCDEMMTLYENTVVDAGKYP